LIGDDATEEAVRSRLPEYRFLHFATHGYLSDIAPLLSAVVLANGESLSVYELMGTRIDADLVVLSACDTGRGLTTRGGEVVGLTRGLLAAGARSALVSLWPVDDASTSLLMAEFYRQLRNDRTAAQALRYAQAYVRGLDTESARVDLDRLERALDMRADRNRASGNRALTREMDAGQPAESTPYSHPRHWAPFILVG
jgi:CHAT domain-containing protein